MGGNIATSAEHHKRFMHAALAIASRTAGQSHPNPNVGCIIVKNNIVVGRGWTQSGGRPHAEAMALAQAGSAAQGAVAYITLEPCAHQSVRGPACSDLLISAGIKHVVVALTDPDPRTAGKGIERLEAAGISVTAPVLENQARAVMAGFIMQQRLARPFVTLKLATSLDGQIALANGVSQWITDERARNHAHIVRARSNAILVGGGTYRDDSPSLNVRLNGLQDRSPQRVLLSRKITSPDGWQHITGPEQIDTLDASWLLVEGGAETAAAFLHACLVDRLLLYRAPVLLGRGKAALSDIGLETLAPAHGIWRLSERRQLGVDVMETYEASR